jgi:hypothetical protein
LSTDIPNICDRSAPLATNVSASSSNRWTVSGPAFGIFGVFAGAFVADVFARVFGVAEAFLGVRGGMSRCYPAGSLRRRAIVTPVSERFETDIRAGYPDDAPG